MAITTFVYRALWGLALLVMIAGCTNPVAHPKEEPPPVRDGVDLDRSATVIAPDPSGLPYIVRLITDPASGDTLASDWIIPAGQTVTVMPGTEIMFYGLLWVDVQGQIIANGNPNLPVVFTSAMLEPDLGDWRGFKLANTDPGLQSEFHYCVFSWGAYFDDDTLTERGRDAQNYRGMLSVRNSSPIVTNCLIYKNQNNGLFISHDTDATLPRPVFRNNIVTQNDGAAVRTGAGVDLTLIDVSYNCLGDNSIPAFLLYQVDSTFGYEDTVNANLDSTDRYFNLDRVPEIVDPLNKDYALTSCSPAVDAGEPGASDDPDGTPRDMGPAPYTQVPGELRGVWSGTLVQGTTYRMSCHVRVPQGTTLTIPAGTRIETTGLYNLEVFGRLDVQGTVDSRVHICACQAPGEDRWGGLRFFNYDTLSAPSTIRNAELERFAEVDVYRPGVEFDNVIFTGGYNYGAAVLTHSTDMADSVSFRNCTFTNCGSYGIQVDSSAAMIRNTLIENIKGRGISLNAVGTSAEVTNTIARACSTSGIIVTNLSSPLIVNSVLTDNGYHGIHLINNCLPTIMNCIVYANHRYGIESEQSSLPQVSYSNIADNGLSNLHPTTTPCIECISQNPLFTGSDGAQLGAGSPSVDAGNPDPQYNDADGTRNDQGAHGGPMGSAVGALGFRSSNQRVVMR